ncbi:MAG: hypothetical protein M3Z50_01275 [Actinomycetota bacterium]|nr:hypothetical protein [Actinomycetota bacterium]
MTALREEVAAPRAGDDIVADADVVMDRAFTVNSTPAQAWPWLVQLGKGRGGWYLPRSLERFRPPSRRAPRDLDPAFQHLQVGEVIPDYGGKEAMFEVAVLSPPTALVYRSRRGQTEVSWSITLTPAPGSEPGSVGESSSRTRIHLRLRLGPVRHQRLAETAGDLVDLLTIAGMAAGLRERLRETAPG